MGWVGYGGGLLRGVGGGGCRGCIRCRYARGYVGNEQDMYWACGRLGGGWRVGRAEKCRMRWESVLEKCRAGPVCPGYDGGPARGGASRTGGYFGNICIIY